MNSERAMVDVRETNSGRCGRERPGDRHGATCSARSTESPDRLGCATIQASAAHDFMICDGRLSYRTNGHITVEGTADTMADDVADNSMRSEGEHFASGCPPVRFWRCTDIERRSKAGLDSGLYSL